MDNNTKTQISSAKLEIIQNAVESIPTYVENITKMRPNEYKLKEIEWNSKCNDIRKIIEDKSYFLFIGRFSSGKSSFINSILGYDLLPTSSQPCTAVVTEVFFKEEGKSNGKIIRNGQDIPEVIIYEDLLDIIQGKKKTDYGSIHHVELSININEKFDEENRGIFKSLVDKVVLVDCPGFDSPYRFSEDILFEYIEKASFTFYLIPCDDFGGLNEVKRLRNLNRKTSTMIPLISKSDKINSREEQEVIIEKYEEALSDNFENKEAIFISNYKFKDYQKLYKELEGEIITGKITDEDTQKLYSVRMQSGIDQVINQIAACSKSNDLNEQKIKQVEFEFDNLIKDMLKSAASEENHWAKQLGSIQFDISSQTYKDLEKYNTAIRQWIEEESDSTSKELKNELTLKITNYLNGSATTPSGNKIEAIFADCFNGITQKNRNKWNDKFKDYFKSIGNELNINDIKYDIPTFNFGIPGTQIFKGVIDGVSKSGYDVIFTGLVGGGLIACKSAIAGIALVGTFLAPVVGIAGVAGLIVAGIKSYNPIMDGIKSRKEERKNEISRQVGKILNECNYKGVIYNALDNFRQNAYEEILKNRKNDNDFILRNYESSKNLREKLENINL